MRFARDVCLQFDAALGRHWLETDGLGGYASSTLFVCPTSRYDGLLVAPSREQPERHLFLSRFEETFRGEGQEFPISDARYGGSFGPGGHRFVDHCDFATRPSFTYRIGQVEVVREIQMVRGRPVVLIRYAVTGQRKPLELRLRPLFPCRRSDGLTWRNEELDGTVAGLHNGIAVQPYAALPQVVVTMSGGDGFEADATWFQGLEYADDIRRGYDGHEDQWSPGELRVSLESGAEIVVAVTIGEPVEDPAALWRHEAKRRAAAPAGPGVRGALDAAAEHYLYRAADGRPGVIAGYPWFGEWGRDTLIALPGLTLARGRVEACGDVLVGLLPFLRDGRLPNVFGPTPDECDYRAVDPAMWFARAVRLYADAQGDPARDEGRLLGDLLPALRTIAEAHHALSTDDGLVSAGTPDVATTWMDAVIDGRPVTPRHGLAVEVNALWYQLLDTLAMLLRRSGDEAAAKTWDARREATGAAFLRRFWIESKGRLADRVSDGVQDDTIRPNMVIAAALDPSPLSREQRTAVVDVVRAELLTRRGLRTLSPRYLRYRGRFEGNQHARDDAYHQGTVWPWLLGFYVEASLRAYGATKLVTKRLRVLLDGFDEHLGEHGVGHVSEVFDGDPPQRPGGCFAQAWSVGELLRAYTLLDVGGER